ncbi:MAG: CDP-diacylglycerol--serine O-phosphatidyltransferase 2 [Betaproteobacteria bacterium]|nr:CDP-diacylglycerol--serine O-phosphatidyltransferase 2 [Betaproteobacteria bacterium]
MSEFRPRNNTRASLRRRGVYLLPNAFTTAALFGGFYAIVQAMNGEYVRGCMAIFIAMVLDSLDGRVARMTHTQSDFGAEYDSLSDMVSFGAAPALIMYEWTLRDLGQWGWFAAFVYCAGAALRLARFNTNIEVVDKRYFQGMPSPAAAAMMVGFIWLSVENRLPLEHLNAMTAAWLPDGVTLIAVLGWLISVYAGTTMVSNVPFYSFKDLGRYKRVPVAVIFLLGIGMFVIQAYPPLVLFSLFVIYGASGYVVWLWNMKSGKRSSDMLKKAPAPEEDAEP